jgi:hypothetical protein
MAGLLGILWVRVQLFATAVSAVFAGDRRRFEATHVVDRLLEFSSAAIDAANACSPTIFR